MARIRSIKPEFPQSESMGRVSRDARLLFVLIWTQCDDRGRARAASRMLASLLFPYDDDAPKKIDCWLDELQREECIHMYEVNGSRYLQVCNWLKHQKIDRPSSGNFPEPDDDSRGLARAREDSCRDQGSKDQGSKDQGKDIRLRKRKMSLPENFGLSERVKSWAAENGHNDLDRHLENFIGLAIAKGYQYVDWDQALMNAIRQDWAKLKTEKINGAIPPDVAGGGRRAL